MVRVELLKESLFIALFQEFSMRLCQKASRCHFRDELRDSVCVCQYSNARFYDG